MAIVDLRDTAQIRHGVTLGLYPSSDSSFDIGLERAVGSSASTGFTQIARLNPSEGQLSLVYTDPLPNDNIYRYYRARHIKDGYTNGSYTTIARAKPAEVIATRSLPNVQLSGQPIGVNMQIAATKTVKVGSQVVPASETKTMRIHAGGAGVNLSTILIQRFSNGIASRQTANTQFLQPVDIPIGVTITGAAARGNRPTTGRTWRVRLQKISNGTLQATLWDKTSTQTGEHTISTTTISSLVGSTQQYNFLFDMASTAGGAVDHITHWLQLSYTMPDYLKAR